MIFLSKWAFISPGYAGIISLCNRVVYQDNDKLQVWLQLFYWGVFIELDCKIVITVSEHGGNIFHAWKLEEENMAKESWPNAGRLSRAEGRMQRTRWLSLWYVARESVRCEADEMWWDSLAKWSDRMPSDSQHCFVTKMCYCTHTMPLFSFPAAYFDILHALFGAVWIFCYCSCNLLCCETTGGKTLLRTVCANVRARFALVK